MQSLTRGGPPCSDAWLALHPPLAVVQPGLAAQCLLPGPQHHHCCQLLATNAAAGDPLPLRHQLCDLHRLEGCRCAPLGLAMICHPCRAAAVLLLRLRLHLPEIPKDDACLSSAQRTARFVAYSN